MKLNLLILSIFTILSNNVWSAESVSSSGLIIHAAEIGIGKFHRYDNNVHNYSQDNAWARFILGENVNPSTPLVVPQFDGSYTIFFSSLQELLESAVKLAKEKNEQISLININSHGMPGGSWFPKDTQQRDSEECEGWRNSAAAPDSQNYEDYYSAISKDEIVHFRKISQSTAEHFSCVTGLPEWQEVTNKIPNIKSFFTLNAQIHFFSCLVGLGVRGESFTKGLASLLLSSDEGRIETSFQYGLGDWSMSEGMGFWDYQNASYVLDKKDSEQMQKGSIRVASLNKANTAVSGLIEDVDYIYNYTDPRPVKMTSTPMEKESIYSEAPSVIRIPGTRYKAVRR